MSRFGEPDRAAGERRHRLASWHARGVTVEDDRASDRRIGVAFAAVLVVEVALAALADAGVYPLWVWLVLAVLTVLVAGLVFAVVEARAEGTPVLGRSTTRRR